MQEPSEDRVSRLASRITALEELLTHFERTIGDLNDVVHEAQSRLDSLETRVERLAIRLQGHVQTHDE